MSIWLFIYLFIFQGNIEQRVSKIENEQKEVVTMNIRGMLFIHVFLTFYMIWQDESTTAILGHDLQHCMFNPRLSNGKKVDLLKETIIAKC